MKRLTLFLVFMAIGMTAVLQVFADDSKLISRDSILALAKACGAADEICPCATTNVCFQAGIAAAVQGAGPNEVVRAACNAINFNSTLYEACMQAVE